MSLLSDSLSFVAVNPSDGGGGDEFHNEDTCAIVAKVLFNQHLNTDVLVDMFPEELLQYICEIEVCMVSPVFTCALAAPSVIVSMYRTVHRCHNIHSCLCGGRLQVHR